MYSLSPLHVITQFPPEYFRTFCRVWLFEDVKLLTVIEDDKVLIYNNWGHGLNYKTTHSEKKCFIWK